MKKTFLNIPLLQWGSFVSAGIAAILQMLAMLFSHERTENYFVADSPLPIIAAIFALISLLTGFAAALIHRKEIRTEIVSRFHKLHYATAFGFLCALSGVVVTLTQRALDIWERHTDSQRFFRDYLSSTPAKLMLLSIPFLILAIVYCVLLAHKGYEKDPPKNAWFGLAAIIACALLSVTLYFDMSVEMNAPAKIFLQGGCLCAMIFFTAELRRLLGKKFALLLLMLSTLVISMGSLSFLAIPVAYPVGIVHRFDHFTYSLFLLCMLPTALGQILDLFISIPQKSDPTDSDTERTETI